MEKVIEQLEILRHFTGNTQLGYLSTFKSDLLKEILEYTYNPHKKYKIDEGKYDKITTTIGNKLSLHQEDWNDFKSFLDTLAEKKSATDKDVLAIKTFIDKYEEADFLKMVLFKDLRLNMNIKKFQKVWPNFCVEPQVQLAQKFEGVKYPYSLYSRKLDGLRAYYKDGVAISRTNKPHKTEPLAHITAQLKQFVDYDAWVYDGEIIYLNPDGTEDFTKAISLARSDNRTPECDNLYYCIFDMIQKEAFENKTPDVATFKDEYTRMKAHLGIVEEKRDWYVTSQPNILLLKQVDETGLEELQQNRIKYNYEGIMIRNADAHYEYKRSNNIRKIKEMQDDIYEIRIMANNQYFNKCYSIYNRLKVLFKKNIYFLKIDNVIYTETQNNILEKERKKYLDFFQIKTITSSGSIYNNDESFINGTIEDDSKSNIIGKI